MRIIKDNSNPRNGYELKCEWPENCFVQGGSNGVVICKKEKNYFTYYVEAFPKDPECFIRGEGNSFEEAENNAYDKYIQYHSCLKHEFVKTKGYKNGMGTCIHCGLRKVVFEPEYTCVICGKHECFTDVIKKHKKEDTDCLCEDCHNKPENFYLLDTFTIGSKVNFHKSLFHCVLDEKTFNQLKHLYEKETLAKDKLYEILSKDSNIFIVPYLERIESLEDLSEYKYRYLILNYYKLLNDEEGEIDIVKYFFDNYMKKFIEIGYK